MMGLKIVGDFGASIAAPVILFVWIGQWLDEKYESGSWYTVGAFILAAALSGAMIYRKAKAYGREYQNLDSKPGENFQNKQD